MLSKLSQHLGANKRQTLIGVVGIPLLGIIIIVGLLFAGQPQQTNPSVVTNNTPYIVNTNQPANVIPNPSAAQQASNQAWCIQDPNFFDLFGYNQYIWPYTEKSDGPQWQTNPAAVRCSVALQVIVQEGQKVTQIRVSTPSLVTVTDSNGKKTVYFQLVQRFLPFPAVVGMNPTVLVDFFVETAPQADILAAACYRISIEKPDRVVGLNC